MNRTWIFKVASSPDVGAGHMSRCISLARALVADEPRVRPVFVLDPDGLSWTEALDRAAIESTTGNTPRFTNVAACVMDGYRYTDEDARWMKSISGKAPLILIDDHSVPLEQADLVINSGFHVEGDVLNDKPALLGPAYAMLSPEFAAIEPRRVRDTVGNVLVALGMIDSGNATEIVLAALSRLLNEGLWFSTVVAIGPAAPNLPSLRRTVAEFPGDIDLMIGASDMASRISAADLMIGAGGVGLLERLAAGTPSVTVVQSQTQAASVEAAAAAPATLSAGPVEELTADTLAGTIGALMADRPLREELANKGRAMVDGRGAERVARAVQSFVDRSAAQRSAATG